MLIVWTVGPPSFNCCTATFYSAELGPDITRKTLEKYVAKPDAASRFVQDPAFVARTGKEMGGLTGGWAGGELGLKEGSMLALKVGTLVKVKGDSAEWKKNAIFKCDP